MTDDFFATLRNIPLSVNKNPILMITCTPIDTISSATRDLSAKGMPFHADTLLKSLESSINEASLSTADHVLLDSYCALLSAFKRRRTLPSLAYYDEEIRVIAQQYVRAYRNFFEQVQSGDILKKSHNDTLKLGTVHNAQTNTWAFSPVHPLNVMYQLQLLEESGVGAARDDVLMRLSAANLLPYIKGEKQHSIYEVVEQHTSPEWRYYAPVDGDRYNGIRDFVPKLVAEKIEEYYAHFRFLFKDIGENQMIINIHNLGDCSFFYQDEMTKDLLIIHYGDQNSSASGYNAITVTRKSEQYENIIKQELAKKNIIADVRNAKKIIDFFNAINGRWLLRLISSKRALDSTFSREKMSIISAIKFAMAYYSHKDIVWIWDSIRVKRQSMLLRTVLAN